MKNVLPDGCGPAVRVSAGRAGQGAGQGDLQAARPPGAAETGGPGDGQSAAALLELY